MVSRKPARLMQPYFAMARTWRGRTSAHRANTRPSDEMLAATHARSRRIPQRLWRAVCKQISQRASVRVKRAWRRKSHKLRARRIANRAIRWQFELARTGLDADQLLAHRIVAEISSLLRRGFSGRMPNRFRAVHDPEQRRE